MDIIQYITKELYRKQEVVIPGFGKFVGKREAAQQTDTTILPPRQKIEFIRDTKSFALDLAMVIATEEKITEDDAAKAVNQFVAEANKSLETDSKVVIAGIGVVQMAENGAISFEQDASSNLLADTFGMEATLIPNLTDSPKGKVAAKKTAKISTEKEAESSMLIWWISGAVALVLIVVGGWWFFLRDVNRADNKVADQEQVTDDKQYNTDITAQPVGDSAEVVSADNTIAEDIEPVQQTQTKPQTAVPASKIPSLENTGSRPIYLIVGSYKSRENAQERATELSNKGFSTEVLDGENGYFRVSIGKFPDADAAILVAKKFSDAYPDQEVWAL